MIDKNCGCNDPCGKNTSACIHTHRIMDSCLDKDCIEDLRVYLPKPSQQVLDRCTCVKVRSVELLHVDTDVAPAVYKKGCYSIDLTFYYRVISDAMVHGTHPETLCGLGVFTKRVVLFGGCGGAKVFHGTTPLHKLDCKAILCQDVPRAVVEALDPMILAAKVVELCDCCRQESTPCDIPACILNCFDTELVLSGETKRLQISIGQFSTIRLERDAQLRLPTLEYCVPDKQCCDDAGCTEDPCELFGRIDFPTEAFYPIHCNSAPASCVSFDESGC